MVDYTKLAATAQRLIEANGRLVTLYKRDRTPAVAGQPWRGPDDIPTPPDGIILGPIRVAFIPPRGSGLGELFFDAEETLKRGITKVGLMATASATALSVTEADIQKMDTLVDDGKALKIVQVEQLKPADTSLLFVFALQS